MTPIAHLPNHLRLQVERSCVLRDQVTYRGRFAPTPSGPLHLGNLQTALLSWLRAKQARGLWLLRIDDLDTPRIRPGSIAQIVHDLRWLGLTWDGPLIFQSRRRGIYYSWLSWLRRAGFVYPCRCTRRQLSGFDIYPGFCRTGFQPWGWTDRRLPCWRLRLSQFAPRHEDCIVRRADQIVSYHFASVIDDALLGITDILRGEDLFDVASLQKSLFDFLEFSTPTFDYAPLRRDHSGRKLSKRLSSSGLQSLASSGFLPEDVIGLLAADLSLVPRGSRLSADDLLSHVISRCTSTDS